MSRTLFACVLCCACQPMNPHNAASPVPPQAEPAPVNVSSTQDNATIATSEISVPPRLAAIFAATDRSVEDRALDAGRKSDQLLAFLDLKESASVVDIGAGGGYTTELLARVVGPNGKVYAQNSKFILERFAEKPLSERLQKPVMKNVVRLDREFSAPIPPEVHGLDAVVNVLFYHDTFWMDVDRPAMNAAIYAALRPGGIYFLVDHSAKPGRGSEDVQTLHRVERLLVQQDVEKAGFRLLAEGHFLENPEDTRDWNASPSKAGDKRGTSDRFVLKFQKPEAK